MKNFYLTCFCFFIVFTNSIAQDELQQLPEIIKENTTLKKNRQYLTKSDIKIIDSAKLTIEEGVVLISESGKKISFLVEPGAKIIACGSIEKPIKAITNTEANTSITIQPISIKYDSVAFGNKFEYKKIENPTILYSPKPKVDDIIASSTTDF